MFAFTEGDIRSSATSQSFARGQSYYHSGAVSALTLRGDQLTARVAGSDYEPYRVNVALDQDGRIASASCTCPYDWGGYCKHIVTLRGGRKLAAPRTRYLPAAPARGRVGSLSRQFAGATRSQV